MYKKGQKIKKYFIIIKVDMNTIVSQGRMIKEKTVN